MRTELTWWVGAWMALSIMAGCASVTPAMASREAIAYPKPAVADPLQVPLRVQNLSSFPRTEEPVTSGVPLPKESQVFSVDQLQLLDADGKGVPCQFRVLSRWGRLDDEKAPIRWLLLDFQVNVPAEGSAYYRLQKGQPAPISIRIEVSDAGGALDVVTGPLGVRIPKEGEGLFEQLWRIPAGQEGSSLEPGRVALLSGRASLRADKADGPFRSVITKVTGAQVEESGPLRTVVRVHGIFRSPSGATWVGGDARSAADKMGRPAAEEAPIEFDARFTLYAGKSYLKVSVTLENNGNSLATYYPVNDTFFDSLYLDIPLQMESIKKVLFPELTTSELDASWALKQTHEVRDPLDEKQNFLRVLTHDGQEVKRGKRADGWVAVCSEQWCWGTGVKGFWQNYPKSLEVSKNGIAVGLWPATRTSEERGNYGHGHYFFSGGWHKTHELVLAVWNSRGSNPYSETPLLQASLFALAPPSWYADSRGWSLIAPVGFQVLDQQQREAIDRYERYRAVLVDPEVSSAGITIDHLRETRGLATPKLPGFHFDLDLYGWEFYGEIPWGGNHAGLYSALHYDWPYIMWLHLIRSGDLRYLPFALQMTDHSSDLDQIHQRPSKSSVNKDGIWWWEQLRDGKGHHRSSQGAGSIISHTWNGGYSLGYLLTGNPRYLEAATAGAMAGRRFWLDLKNVTHSPVVFDQTRSQAWSILMLVNLYRVDGRVEHLQDALIIFKNSLLYTEQLSSTPGSVGKGFITHNNPRDKANHGKAIITFLTYPLEPLSELHYDASLAGLDVKQLEAYLIRSLDWLKNFAYVGGVADKIGGYSPLTLSYATDPNDRSKNQGGAIAHNIHVAGGFAYGYLMLKDNEPQKAGEYLGFARALFRDLMFYRQKGDLTRGKLIDSNLRGPISLGWPGTFTKELGWIGRSGQFYLNAEYVLAKKGGGTYEESKGSH